MSGWLDFEHGSYEIRGDFAALQACCERGMPDAIAFYAGRMARATLATAVARSEGEARGDVHADLNDLALLDLVPPAALAAGHALGRLDRLARLPARALSRPEGDDAVVFLALWMGAFFASPVMSPVNDPPDGLTSLAQSRGPDCWELMNFASGLDAGDGNADLADIGDRFRRSPTAAALIAELALNRDRMDLARTVLDGGLAAKPSDRRLRQLDCLWHSRLGDLDAAAAGMEALLAESGEDSETLGIFGGIVKRRWLGAPADLGLRDQAFRAYFKGWRLSGDSNVYLGVNAATLALLSDDSRRARQVSEQVLEMLNAAVARKRKLSGDGLGLWETLTLAEANLVAGAADQAREGYADAAARFPDQSAALEVAFQQAELVRRHLGMTEPVAP